MLHKIFKNKKPSSVAYFTMELGIDPNIPTYSGGLGVLAGDTLKAFADINYPIVAVTMLNEKGYFKQKINKNNEQVEMPDFWTKEKYLRLMAPEVSVRINGRNVKIRVWKYDDKNSVYAKKLDIYFLDTNIKGNSDYDRELTSFLYGRDKRYRLCQEMVLGIGGLRILKKLGYNDFKKYHINEGHASFLCLELLKSKLGHRTKINEADINEIKEKCAFTTHTPIAAGHDRFEIDLVKEVMGDYLPPLIFQRSIDEGNKFNMTLVALNLCRFVNGVAKRHEEKTKDMFPGYEINSITNGIHTGTWVSKHFDKLYNKYLNNWQASPYSLRYVKSVPGNEIWQAHEKAKKDLLDYIEKKTKIKLKNDILTIGFARRFAVYKRSDLIFHDLKRLKEVAGNGKGLQIVMAGKAHPNDSVGKKIIKDVLEIQRKLNQSSSRIKVVFLENYNMSIAKLMVGGADVWLNNPQRPYEASGTSGMKAALNGVPHLSTMDGWWLEGCIEGATGWGIGPHPDNPRFKEDIHPDDEAQDLYKKLEEEVLPIYYEDKKKWIDIMADSIAVNASFFNTYRMVKEYIEHVY